MSSALPRLRWLVGFIVPFAVCGISEQRAFSPMRGAFEGTPLLAVTDGAIFVTALAVTLCAVFIMLWDHCEESRQKALEDACQNEQPSFGFEHSSTIQVSRNGDVAAKAPRGPDDEPHICILDMQTGRMTRSNPKELMEIDNDVCSGSYVLLHRPLDRDKDSLPEKPDLLADHFKGKVRLWEVRFQLTFKKDVRAADLRLGTGPFVRIPVGLTQVAVQRSILGALGPAVRGFYNSPGDVPGSRPLEDIEPPVTSICVSESDQHIFTAPTAPKPQLLGEHFSSLGRRKTANPSAYRTEIGDLVLRAGETHTFSMWGPSKLLNLITWQCVGIPLMRPFSLDGLNGPPPILLSVYVLGPPVVNTSTGRKDTRHTPSRMTVLYRVAGWPSTRPPVADVMRKLRRQIANPSDDDVCLDSPSSPESRSCRLPLRALSPTSIACFEWFPSACFGDGIRKLVSPKSEKAVRTILT